MCTALNDVFSSVHPEYKLMSPTGGSRPSSAIVDACPGYNARNVKVDGLRLSAKLDVIGKPCNVFRNDIEVLRVDLAVVYDSVRD